MKKFALLSAIVYAAIAPARVQTSTPLFKRRASTTTSPTTVYPTGSDLYTGTPEKQSKDNRGYHTWPLFQNVPQPPTVYKNVAQSYTAMDPTGRYTATIGAGKYESTESQSDADNKGLIAAQKQAEPSLVSKDVPTAAVLRGYAQATAGSNVLTLLGNMVLPAGTKVIFEPDTLPRGFAGPGKQWPDIIFNTIAEMKEASLPEGTYVSNAEDGYIHRAPAEKGADWPYYGKWGADKFYPKSLLATVVKKEGQKVYLDNPSATTVSGRILVDETEAVRSVIVKAFLKQQEDGERQIVNLRQALRRNPGDTLNISETLRFENSEDFKEGRIYPQNVTIDFDGLVLRSPKGVQSIALRFENGNDPGEGKQIILKNGIFIGNGNRDNGVGLDWSRLPQTNEVMDNPYLWTVSLGGYCWRMAAYNVTVYNSPSYAIQGFDTVDGFKVFVKGRGMEDYTGWLVHNLGGGVKRNGIISSDEIVRGLEFQQCLGGLFEHIRCTNVVAAQNAGSDNTWRDVEFRFTKGAAESDPKMLANPVITVNELLAGDHKSGSTFENVNIIQEDYLTSAGALLRGLQVNDDARDITITNCTFTRPDVLPPFLGNAYGRALRAPADGLLIDGFTVNGKMNPLFGGWSAKDNGLIEIIGSDEADVRNVAAESMYVGPNVKLTGIKAETHINRGTQ